MRAAASVAVVLSACAPANAPAGTNVVVDAPVAWRSTLRLAVGRNWVDPATAETRPIDTRVADDVAAVAVFADVDGNERLDPFAEPSAPCACERDGWLCRLDREVVVDYRLDQVDERNGTRFIPVVRSFDADRLVATEIEACVGDDDGCRSPWRTTPWESRDAELSGVCGESAPTIWLRSRDDARAERVALPTPGAISAAIDVASDANNDIRLDAVPDRNTTRQIVWVERDGVRVWSTEDAPGMLRVLDDHVTATIPSSAADCSSCEVWLGLASTEWLRDGSQPPVMVVSELRVALRAGGFL